jgi:uncharacterized protein with ACT and thioredoxin-like domain
MKDTNRERLINTGKYKMEQRDITPLSLSMNASVVQWSEFVVTDPGVPGSIPGTLSCLEQ